MLRDLALEAGDLYARGTALLTARSEPLERLGGADRLEDGDASMARVLQTEEADGLPLRCDARGELPSTLEPRDPGRAESFELLEESTPS